MPAVDLERQVEDLHAGRITTAEGEAMLARLAQSGMIDNGQVVALGLDAIRTRFGDRWPRKGEQVWDAAMQHVRRRLGPGDVAARIGEVDVVIAVGAGRDHAQALGLAVMQELLTFFLGEARPADMRLRTVSWVSGKEIICNPIPIAGIPLFAPGETATFAPPAGDFAPQPAPPPPWRRMQPSNWSALTLAVGQGRPLAARCVVQPLVELADRRQGGFRIDSQIRDRTTGRILDPALVGLNTVEALALDLSTAEFACSLAGEDGGVVTPLSFETVSTSRGRSHLMKRAGGLPPPILEIIGVDAGTPHGRLTETVALLGAFARQVVIRIDLHGDLKARLQALKGVRADGLSIDLAPLPIGFAEERMTQFAALARGLAPCLYAFSTPAPSIMERAGALGFTHATLAGED